MSQTFAMSAMWSRSNEGEFAEGDLGALLGALPALSPTGPWIAGGALRRTLIGKPLDSDFDFFFADADQLEAFAAALSAMGLTKHRETEHHVHFKGHIDAAKRDVDIQCIRFRYYASAEEVIDSFDYTICQFAFDGETLTCGDFALWDLGRRALAIHKITYPVASMRRLLKYGQQGFTACSGCMAQLLRDTAASPELLSQLEIAYVD